MPNKIYGDKKLNCLSIQAFAAFNYISADLGFPINVSLAEAERHIKVMCDYSVDQLHYVKSTSQSTYVNELFNEANL